MKETEVTFFDFAPIYREIFPVNDEICSKTSTKMEYDGIKCKYRHPSSHIFRQKSPVKSEQREQPGDFPGSKSKIYRVRVQAFWRMGLHWKPKEKNQLLFSNESYARGSCACFLRLNCIKRETSAADRRRIICEGKQQQLFGGKSSAKGNHSSCSAASRMRGEAQLFLCDELHKKGKSQLGLNWNHISDSGLYENHIIIYLSLIHI